MRELNKNPMIKELINKGLIEKIIFLRSNEKGRRIEVEEEVC